MDPLRLTPGQWRALRFLHTYSASAARIGFRATQLRERTGVTDDELGVLADLGHVAGRMHGDTAPPVRSIVITGRDSPKLRVHLTKAGKQAAREIAPAIRALEILLPHAPMTVDEVQHDAGVSGDTLERLFQRGHLRREYDGHGVLLLSLTTAGRGYAEPQAKGD